MHKTSSHVKDYVVLFLLLSIGFFAFVQNVGIPQRQLQVGMVMAITYVVWGIFHHATHHDLHWKIVIEYTALASIAFIILAMLLIYI